MFLDKVLNPPAKSNADSHWKSVLKAISWRVVGTADTVFIAWLITGTLEWALSIGGIEVVSKMVLYYLHERAWQRIS